VVARPAPLFVLHLAILAASACSVIADLGDPRDLRDTDAAEQVLPDGEPRLDWDAPGIATEASDGATGCDAGACRPTHGCSDLAICGATGIEDCCLSLLVKGGTFYRRNDNELPATVSDFRLDKYEVTVGRYRKFVAAVSAGWKPQAGSGKHSYLRAGGLVNGVDQQIESGWDPAMNTELPSNQDAWDQALMCPGSIWTPAPGTNETRPVGCVEWAQAYAYCIWDGGFLPSYAEWNYAAMGGAKEWKYPWGNEPAPSADRATYCPNYCGGATPLDVGGTPLGDGLWGHSDLVGNVWEWLLDNAGGEPVPCIDCMRRVPDDDTRYDVGGAFDSTAGFLATDSTMGAYDPMTYHGPELGFRCARAP
jgi:formylglycine-generating enzyme required for sulfatase activity